MPAGTESAEGRRLHEGSKVFGLAGCGEKPSATFLPRSEAQRTAGECVQVFRHAPLHRAFWLRDDERVVLWWWGTTRSSRAGVVRNRHPVGFSHVGRLDQIS